MSEALRRYVCTSGSCAWVGYRARSDAFSCCPMCGAALCEDLSETQPERALDVQEGGVKFDGGKPPVVRGVIHYFPRAMVTVAEVSVKGAEKYSWRGWESIPDGFGRYTDALGRHLVAESISDTDEETGCLHAAQVAWNALARLELLLRDLETDDASDNA